MTADKYTYEPFGTVKVGQDFYIPCSADTGWGKCEKIDKGRAMAENDQVIRIPADYIVSTGFARGWASAMAMHARTGVQEMRRIDAMRPLFEAQTAELKCISARIARIHR